MPRAIKKVFGKDFSRHWHTLTRPLTLFLSPPSRERRWSLDRYSSISFQSTKNFPPTIVFLNPLAAYHFSTQVMQFPFLSKKMGYLFWAAGPLRNHEKSCKITKIEKLDKIKGFLPPAGQRPAGRAGRAGWNSLKILQNPILGWPGLLKPFMNLAHLAQSERAPGLLCGALSNSMGN